MSDERALLKNRFIELAKKSYNAGIFTFTDFLGLAEQDVFEEAKAAIRPLPYTLFGGVEGTERVMIRFGDAEELGYEIPFPIATVKVEPLSQRFADKLTHRDFLGSILNLGIERRAIGDIVIRDNVGYVFATEDMAKYIADSLIRIKHTDVRATVTDEVLTEGELYKTEPRRVQLSSERVDALVAKVFALSRDDAQALFKRGLVFVSGRCIESVSHTPRIGDVISVRGYGRMVYRGQSSTSKKGKLNVDVDLYI